MVNVKCLFCGKSFKVYRCNISRGKGKFCSPECMYAGIEYKPNSGSFKKGARVSIKTEFKKGMSGEKHPRWAGGVHRISNGYVVENRRGHPRAYRNEVYQHILVAEEKIGRNLNPGEVVHHINGIRHDNRPENLVVCVSNVEHIREFHTKKNRGKKT